MMLNNNNKIFNIEFSGLTLKGDMAIIDGESIILLSCYGSESAINSLFATLGMGNKIKIDGIEAHKTYWNHIRLKKTRIGYGKYHGVIHIENIHWYLIVFPDETLIDGYKRYLYNRPIPILDEWIPELHQYFLSRKIFTPIKTTINVQAYETNFDSNSICDEIVNYLKFKKLAYRQASNQ
ncbi:hypothetical protein V4D30_00730 [Thermodesulfovibrio sp. 3907-1M]|uniref:Uncharacterized protein n=1 Tax=Thermodesulfovibrio autotrophicus TaxID=3118333 RepID=A0AAU8GWG5_9BACT